MVGGAERSRAARLQWGYKTGPTDFVPATLRPITPERHRRSAISFAIRIGPSTFAHGLSEESLAGADGGGERAPFLGDHGSEEHIPFAVFARRTIGSGSEPEASMAVGGWQCATNLARRRGIARAAAGGKGHR